MALQLITPAVPAATITVAEARVACRIHADETSFDDLLTLLLAGAVEEVGNYIGQGLAPQGWQLTLDAFCGEAIELPLGPVTAVAEVGHFDPEGLVAAVDPGDYVLDLVSRPQWVVLNEGAAWPETLDAVNAVWVNFTAGYTAETLPSALKGAVLGLVQHRFDNGMSEAMPDGVRRLADQFRRIVI